MATKITTGDDQSRIYALLGARYWRGGYREYDIKGDLFLNGSNAGNYSVGHLEMLPKSGGGTLVTAYLYKGEWYTTDIERMVQADRAGESIQEI